MATKQSSGTQPAFDTKDFIATLPHQPGIYQMLDAKNQPLYIGKAKDLKRRLPSYFRKYGLSQKTQMMMSQVSEITITVTNTEAEALLLENNLIKNYLPRYNVLLRDDKSYPYIYISNETFPRIVFRRGARKADGQYFGPYPSVSAVKATLNLLQKLFKLRSCQPAFFNNRSRPCLQYQIKRCSAPCVGLITSKDYQQDLSLARQFLEGNSQSLIETLIKRMDTASQTQCYEEASHYRDQVATLRQVSEQQLISDKGGDTDIIAASIKEAHACVQVFNVRGGMNIGNKAFYPNLPDSDINIAKLLTAFVGQYYLSHPIPDEILLSHTPYDKKTLVDMLCQKAERRIKLTESATRGKKKKYLVFATKNADMSLKTKLSSRASLQKRLQNLQEALSLATFPTRMECFDISHTMGEKTVGACVVFNQTGAVKQDYRRFNITQITAGDDYAALRQAVERRYRRIQQGEAKLPDILFIDGGKGQVKEVQTVLKELGILDLAIIGVAKGEGRKAGLETLIHGNLGIEIKLEPDSPALHLVQQIRDEAHRFAIAGHRQQRDKARRRSPLEDIPGLGRKRRQNLLRYFGGAQGISRASIEELEKVPGISEHLAKSVYQVLHG